MNNMTRNVFFLFLWSKFINRFLALVTQIGGERDRFV